MRLAFFGTPEFAAAHLRRLLESRHQVVCVLTQPDRPSGRGRRLESSAVKKLVLAQPDIRLLQPASLTQSSENLRRQLAEMHLDLAVVAAYGMILPDWLLRLPAYGCLNVHASLLPRWRGASPTFASILAGDKTSGVTFMDMDAGLDTGGIYRQFECEISPCDTAGALLDKIQKLGCAGLVRVIDDIGKGLIASPQPEGASEYGKITPQQCRMDFACAEASERLVRAALPNPGARLLINADNPQDIVKVHSAKVLHRTGEYAKQGQITSCDREGVAIACKQGELLLTSLQWPGGKTVAASVVAQHPRWSERLKKGTRLPLPD